jgi:hypothetical protein
MNLRHAHAGPPNISSERTAHSIRFVAIHSVISCGPPLKLGVMRLREVVNARVVETLETEGGRRHDLSGHGNITVY